MYCANCGLEIKKASDWPAVNTGYYKYLDNFLQVKYFDAEDGSDNIFCSVECACESLMLEHFELNEEESEHEQQS